MPWDYRSDWLSVKHQITYLLTSFVFRLYVCFCLFVFNLFGLFNVYFMRITNDYPLTPNVISLRYNAATVEPHSHLEVPRCATPESVKSKVIINATPTPTPPTPPPLPPPRHSLLLTTVPRRQTDILSGSCQRPFRFQGATLQWSWTFMSRGTDMKANRSHVFLGHPGWLTGRWHLIAITTPLRRRRRRRRIYCWHIYFYITTIHTHTHARTHARTNTHARTHARTQARTHTRTHTHTHAHTHIHTHTHSHARTHTHTHTHAHTHTYTHTARAHIHTHCAREHTHTLCARAHTHTVRAHTLRVLAHARTHAHTHTHTHTTCVSAFPDPSAPKLWPTALAPGPWPLAQS